MKYCTKCGNELHDESVICPKCGCPVEVGTKDSVTKQSLAKSAIKTANILNIVALLLNIVVIAFLVRGAGPDTYTPPSDADITIVVGDGMADEEEWRADRTRYLTACGAWGFFAATTFILGMVLNKQVSTSKGAKIVYLYIVLAIAAPVSANIIFPEFMGLLLCGIGLLMFAPLIIQIIAATKYMKATPSHG